MAKKKLTKGQLLEFESYIEHLYKNFGLSKEVYEEVKSKIDGLYPNAPDIYEHTEL